jgi:CubicO group peptidase (beta-lactamase class C family)
MFNNSIMKTIIPALLSTFLLGSGACQRQSGNMPLTNSSPGQITYTYQPPAFEEKDRIGKVGQALAGSHHYYSEMAERNHLPALAYGLVVDDSLVFYGACGTSDLKAETTVTEHTLFRIASMSKSFTAMAILMLRDEGMLALSDPVSVYLPELEGLSYLTSDAAPVSIFNLLTMTAGFPEDNPWGDRFLDISEEALMNQVKTGISFSTVPTLHYEYSNLGFGLLGQIISRVSGLPYQEYITRNILNPLRMTNTYWEYEEVPAGMLALGYKWEEEQWISEPLLHDGAFGAMGGLITSIADFSKYISLHLSAWPPRSDPDEGPVKRSTIREMHRMNNPRYYVDPERFGDSYKAIMRGYGFGLVVMKDHEGVLEVGHNGGLPGFGSSYMFYPQHGVGIMAFSNLTYVGGAVRAANYKVMEELVWRGLFVPRRLPVSEILALRKEQVKNLLLTWDPELEKEIVAANLYLDISREKRMEETGELLNQLGEILSTGPMIPENQLRGSFLLEGEKQNLRVYFTLTPEADPRVQWLTLELLQ